MSGHVSFAGSIPEEYDRGLGPVIFAGYASDMARRAASLAPVHVLELAAGTGIVTRQLRDRLPAETNLTATDLNPPMLDVARRKFAPGERVTFATADAMSLPFADAAFDAVVCQFGVMFFPDKARAYNEVHRVLAPGGRYLFSVWDSHRHNPYGRIAHEVVSGFFPENPPQFYHMPFHYHAIDPIKEALLDAGFSDIRIHVMPLAAGTMDIAAFARGLVHGNPTIDEIHKRGSIDPERIVHALTEALSRHASEHDGIPGQAIFFDAAKAK